MRLASYFFLCFSLLGLWAPAALASVSISPARILLERNEKEAEVLIHNRGDQVATYRFSVANMHMTRDGNFEHVTAGKDPLREGFADPMIRFSPKQVTLKPNEIQRVRILIRQPQKLPQGEYRSFMRATRVPEARKLDSTGHANKDSDKQKVGIKVEPRYSLAIPVIIRNQAASPNVSLLSPSVSGDGRRLTFAVSRLGQASVYGDFEVTLRKNKELEEIPIGKLVGVSVLPPLEQRNVTIHLDTEGTLPKGRITIKYFDRESNGDRVLASTTLDL